MLLLRRVTYEGSATAWPAIEDEAGDLLAASSAQLVEALQHDSPIDEFQFMFHPIILGSGSDASAKAVNVRSCISLIRRPSIRESRCLRSSQCFLMREAEVSERRFDAVGSVNANKLGEACAKLSIP